MGRLIALALALIVVPGMASAEPITAFLALYVGSGFATALVAIAENIAISAVISLIAGKPKSSAPAVSDAQVNTRLDTATRWQAGGIAAVGGSIGCFAEKDTAGNLWYIVAHADAELTGSPLYILDGIPVTLSTGSGGFTAGDVITNDFCLDEIGAQWTAASTGTQTAVFRIYTVTPSASAVYGALPAAFTTAFPTLPADFRLAGVCFSIVRCAAQTANTYRNAMKWRGALNLGEPAVVLVGNFNRMYDPRNGAHDINTPSTWTASNGNPAILWAWWRTTKYGRNRPMTEINWANVAAAANTCDTTVLDRASVVTPLYRCGGAWPDNKPRQECEKEILDCCDGYAAYDDTGLAYPVVGYYTAPTLSFTAARDILSAQTQITDDGETAVDGVVVNYIEPSLGYTKQPCAPWQNSDWYSGSTVANYYTIDVLTCQNHNQAVRLAKAIGKRIAATKKAAIATTIKGILAKRERIINLDYDATFQGDFQIVSPVEEDPSGMACTFQVVPVSATSWTLATGEEGVPPQATPSLGLTPGDPTNVAPAVLASVSATGGVGSYTINFTTANDINQTSISLYRGSSNVFSPGNLVHTIFYGPNVTGFDTETGLTAGTKYIWAIPRNNQGKAGPTSGPFTVTVT